jgi:hypothetical protein
VKEITELRDDGIFGGGASVSCSDTAHDGVWRLTTTAARRRRGAFALRIGCSRIAIEPAQTIDFVGNTL